MSTQHSLQSIRAPKGQAFEDLSLDVRPDPINAELFPIVCGKLAARASKLGKVFIPQIPDKFAYKSDTWDVDALILPHHPESWRVELFKEFQILVHRNFPPQMIVVIADLLDSGRYMVDFRTSTPETWDWQVFRYGHGKVFPTAFGAFARCLGYQFNEEGLHARISIGPSNYRYVPITNRPDEVLAIMGLSSDLVPVHAPSDGREVASFLMSSPRFAPELFTDPRGSTSRSVADRYEQRSGHHHPQIGVALSILRGAPPRSAQENHDYAIERGVLGEQRFAQFMRRMEQQRIQAGGALGIDGNEIMKHLGIKPGPLVGNILKQLSEHPEVRRSPLDAAVCIRALDEIRERLSPAH